MKSKDDTKSNSTEYGFGGRLSSVFPSQIIVDLTEVCNLECIHCPHPTFKKSKYYSGKFLDQDLNKKIVDEVRQHGRNHTRFIRYTGEGEPLIHPKGYELIQYAVNNSGVFVTLTTNGTILDETRTKRLLDSGVHLIDISIDAINPETYSKIRVKGNLSVTNTNVNNLIKWIRERSYETKVVVTFIEQPLNKHEVDEFKSYWTNQGAHTVAIRNLHSAAGAVVNIAKSMRESQEEEVRRPCVYPWERIILTPSGHLAFCPDDWIQGSSIADYNTTTVEMTWKSKFYSELRYAHISNNFANHLFCGQCPDWKQTRWPNSGRSYADLIDEISNDQ